MLLKRKFHSKSETVGLTIDKVVSCKFYKKLIVDAKVEKQGNVQAIFGGNYTVDSGTAECVFHQLVQVMDEWGIKNRQAAGLGSEGASVMISRHTGVAARMAAL